MMIQYNPTHLPKSYEINYLYFKKLDTQLGLDFLKKNSQILCVIPCEDGLVVIIRDTKKGALPPYNVQEFNE